MKEFSADGWKIVIMVAHYVFFSVNTLRLRQNGRYFFPDDIFECIFLKENVWILIKISLKFVPKSPINNILALVQIMAWRRPAVIWTHDGWITDAYMHHSASMC